MQADQIVLPVDIANNATVVNQAFGKFQTTENRTTYIGPNHAAESRNLMAMYRTFATKTGNFKGTQKSTVKFTKDLAVPGVDASTTLTAPLIMEISFSIPVGADEADVISLRQHAVALLDADSIMTPLNLQLLI